MLTTPDLIATARAVIHDPATHAHDARAMGNAFLVLALDRGQTIRPENLPRPQHGLGPLRRMRQRGQLPPRLQALPGGVA